MKKLLVPTDLTPIAELGLKLAVQIAKRSEAVISLVNFTRHPIGRSFSAMGDIKLKDDEESTLYMLQLLQANKAKLENLVKKYSTAGVAMEYSIVDDEFKNGIDEYLQQEQIDMVVMGTSGEENATEVFTGNHTEQVIKISSCPVLSVRDGFIIENFVNMVVAVNVIEDGLITLYMYATALRIQRRCWMITLSKWRKPPVWNITSSASWRPMIRLKP
jgi:nucleotide-binding universal stress UspA family protein